MNQEYLTAIVRHTLTAVGGFAMSKGWVDNATVETVIGAVLTLVGVGWSLKHKKDLVANQPEVKK